LDAQPPPSSSPTTGDGGGGGGGGGGPTVIANLTLGDLCLGASTTTHSTTTPGSAEADEEGANHLHLLVPGKTACASDGPGAAMYDGRLRNVRVYDVAIDYTPPPAPPPGSSATGSVGGGGAGGGGGGGGGDGSTSDDASSLSSAGHVGLSQGAVAGLVCGVLFGLVAVVLLSLRYRRASLELAKMQVELAHLRSRSTKISDVDPPHNETPSGGYPPPASLTDVELTPRHPPAYDDSSATTTRAPPLPPLTTLAVTGVIKKGGR